MPRWPVRLPLLQWPVEQPTEQARPLGHFQKAGFVTKVFDTTDIDAVKKRLGIPDDLAACHTAEVADYVIEGHVPAAALKLLLAEKPNATGLAVPGMPIGSPGWRAASPKNTMWFCLGRMGTYVSFIGERSV